MLKMAVFQSRTPANSRKQELELYIFFFLAFFFDTKYEHIIYGQFMSCLSALCIETGVLILS